jgi:hypothetical protein
VSNGIVRNNWYWPLRFRLGIKTCRPLSHLCFLTYVRKHIFHTFSNICPKESFVYHSFQQFIKAYRQKCVPCKIEYSMTFHHRIYLVVSVLLIFLLIFFVMWIYVSEFRVVMSVTIYALNVQCIFTSRYSILHGTHFCRYALINCWKLW